MRRGILSQGSRHVLGKGLYIPMLPANRALHAVRAPVRVVPALLACRPSISSFFLRASDRGVFGCTAERCLQTAQAMAQGLFPNGTGPPGFPEQPIAVQTEQVSIVLGCYRR